MCSKFFQWVFLCVAHVTGHCHGYLYRSYKPERNVSKPSAAYLSPFWGWKTIAKYGWDRSSTFVTESSKWIRWTGSQTVGTPTIKQVCINPQRPTLTFIYISNEWWRVHWLLTPQGLLVKGLLGGQFYQWCTHGAVAHAYASKPN